MLVSLKELKKYVNLDGLNANDIANGLTFAGIEVEEVYSIASGTNLIVGHILECEAHPDSDHLHVLKVDLGKQYGVEQIVCGAPNARKGLKVIVARVGAKLPDGEIKPSTIRGVPSNGMCCSLLELGVDSKYLSEAQTKGIEELSDDAVVGNEDVLGYLGLDDEILNLKILANRPDLLSLYNVAREVGAIFNRKVEIPKANIKADFTTDLIVASETDKCSQFSAREIQTIKVKKSPDFMIQALRSMGVRSINNIVDIGNYVMLLTGQPLHMYDADKLARKELVVKNTLCGEFVALDEKTYEIINGDIVITSNNKMMCLGGVMGSLECAVDENSTHIYIESASFDGATIRHTSNRLGLASESSSRFVKGTNHFQAEAVVNLATQLIKDYCDGKGFSNVVTYQNEKYKENVITTSIDKINGRLGTSFNKEQIENVLNRLDFTTKFIDSNIFEVIAPQFRLDVSCDADISEEIIRILGFSNVKSELPMLDVKVGSLNQKQYRLKTIRDYLVSIGLDECLTYSLLSKKNSTKFNLLNNEEQYRLLNPLTDEREYFRTHILYSLLEVASYNVAHQNKDVALFETSNMVSKTSRNDHLAIVLVGNKHLQGDLQVTPYTFFDVKGIIENIFALLGIENSRYKFERLTDAPELHPGKSAKILFQNNVIGVVGELHPNAYNDFEFGKSPVVVCEINLTSIEEAKVSINKMSPISKFPVVNRDLAFIIDKNISSADIIRVIKTTAKGLVKDANVFDVYEGSNIKEGKKSIAISIALGSDHTLTDKEIVDCMDSIKFELNKKYNIELRM